MHQKHISKCPQCAQVVQWDTVLSGGAVFFKCCNCFYVADKKELTQLVENHHADVAENG